MEIPSLPCYPATLLPSASAHVSVSENSSENVDLSPFEASFHSKCAKARPSDERLRNYALQVTAIRLPVCPPSMMLTNTSQYLRFDLSTRPGDRRLNEPGEVIRRCLQNSGCIPFCCKRRSCHPLYMSYLQRAFKCRAQVVGTRKASSSRFPRGHRINRGG